MSVETIVVTGGSGTIGRAALAALNEHGYHTVNCNRGEPEGSPEADYRRVNLTDFDAVSAALSTVDPDAVVHLGMIPTPDHEPGHAVFESNAMSTYHVLDTAQELGVETVVLASSLSAMGAGFEPDLISPPYLPIDESVPLEPSNAYGMGKQALELVADGFGRRDGSPRTITSLRFPWVTDRETQRETFLEADRRLPGIEAAGRMHADHNTLFSYLDIDDAVRAIRLAVEADFTGHESVFLSAPDTSCETPTAEVVAERYPDVDLRAEFAGHESLIETDKAAELLDWVPRHSWRDL
ncbi:NAD-dependent epimerase/dehydratase family protein [Halapricum hydrolyticum]|uniref:NAD(P)-dependent oxidoreductase n=1 Tax=Halapricum hydrolyticum TaxID=2979991 RepID=A0AAE3ID86_9EURY|nr:NAD(P)-dependent oxidoreductase [Halapricum hydrolyticum]MCU4718972.1 NAD(P)-dependent oxidoreductase [Halapricum hydrolyticum]MCU4727901.1 NAD(P)-dependent oxidoreductase [Halapricum hydrolyticum]